MPTKKTLVIGSCTVDIVIPTPHLPTTTEDLNSGAHHFALGGCAYNASQVLNLLELPYLHSVTIGAGIYGDYVMKELKSRNIPIFRTSPEQHGACLCLVEDSGERSFIAYHGIEYKFDRSWFREVDVASFDQVYLCGLEVEEDTGVEIIAFLEEAHIPTIYFAPGPRLMTIDRTLLDRLMALKPVIHLNDQEILEYTGKREVEEAAKALQRENQNDVIVTMGEKGSLLYTGDETIFLPTEKATVVDTIGAGDCHLGTYMAHRAMGWGKKEALGRANAFATRVIQRKGPTLTREDIKDILEEEPCTK